MVRRPVLIIAAASAIALLGTFPAQGSHPGNPIQPGDIVTGPVGQCTLNFVFDGGGKVYMGIAAHCIEPGQSMSTTGYSSFGTAVYDDDTFTDFGLIEVKSTFTSHVVAAVKGHPGTPTGYTTPSMTTVGDLVKFSGHGLGYGITTTTQEKRVGNFYNDSTTFYCAQGPVIFGDSGGPVLHGPTGRALGIVSALDPPCSPQGVTVEGAITQAGLDGFTITLRTA